MRTFWLSFHRGYQCRHSGACCTSGWPIPVEPDRAACVERAVLSNRVRPLLTPWLLPAIGAPIDVSGVLATTPSGACIWHSPRPAANAPPTPGCGIHAMRPRSCEHFPRVCLVDPRGVHVTLSHYCPTAATMLFEHDGEVDIVEGPGVLESGEVPEGLDARDALPPAATPTRLMGWDEFATWERRLVRRTCRSASEAGWRENDAARFADLIAGVPAPWSWPDAPRGVDQHWRGWMGAAWRLHAGVVGRFLAAKAFASWAAYRGPGTAAVEHGVDVARLVLMVEWARQGTPAGLKTAIRQTDLLLVHYL